MVTLAFLQCAATRLLLKILQDSNVGFDTIVFSLFSL